MMEDSFNKLARFDSIRNQIRISMTREGLEIQLVEKAVRVFFDVGSAHPKDYTRDILIEIPREIGQLPNKIFISGHTDRRLYSFQIAGYADTIPIEPKDPYADANRRIAILVLSRATRLSSSPEKNTPDPSRPRRDQNQLTEGFTPNPESGRTIVSDLRG
jgi:chemotaxis protein MotB